ncbi:hypothetical protein [Cohnella mopanensis]|uniref:hypothetical protein n=1 Tax=Cohnella mopanensis TaxID=2911966 RepID=UPI001EF7D68D|nr:hypothetical protein [Cohnella mopanensis]
MKKLLLITSILIISAISLISCGTENQALESNTKAESLYQQTKADEIVMVNKVTKDPSAKLESLNQQIRMLEKALAAKTPEEAAETWAKAIYTRNGALEYALLSTELKKKELKLLEAGNWVTGVSSPWLERYKISKGHKNSDGTFKFQIKFDFRTSDDMNKKIDWKDIEAFDIRVEKKDGNWYISQIGN